MALPEIDAVCLHCHHAFREQPSRTFLGFQKFTCPHCHREVVYPLTSGYRTTYWVLVAIMALVIIATLAQGRVAVPGLIGIAAIWALDKDRRLRREVADARVANASHQPAAR